RNVTGVQTCALPILACRYYPVHLMRLQTRVGILMTPFKMLEQVYDICVKCTSLEARTHEWQQLGTMVDRVQLKPLNKGKPVQSHAIHMLQIHAAMPTKYCRAWLLQHRQTALIIGGKT